MPRERRRLALGGGAALLAIVALVLASQQYTFGNALRTPYHYHVRDGGETDDQSLDEYKLTDVPRHFAGAFVTGENDHGRREPNTSPILRDFPLLVLMPVGAWVLARRRSRTRAVWMTALAASVVSSVLYLSFVAGGGGDLKFGNARYWSMWFPLWAVLAMVGVAAGVGAITRLARGATVA